jgi:recombination protein RecA
MASQLFRTLERYGIAECRRCVLLMGAGTSASGVLQDGTGLPTWPQLCDRMLDDLVLLGYIDSKRAEQLTQEIHGGSAGGYLEVASLYKQYTDDAEFDRFLRNLLDPPGLRPATLHQHIVALDFRAIVTTNFDRVIELADARLQVYAYPDFLGRADILQSTDTFVLKLHGSVSPALGLKSRLIVSKEDYDGLHSNEAYLNALAALVSGHPVIAIGYSATDPDFLQVMEDLKQRNKVGPFVYAFMRSPADEVSKSLRSSNVKVIPYRDHAEITQLFEELLPPAGANQTVSLGNRAIATSTDDAEGTVGSTAEDGVKSKAFIPTGSVTIDLALGIGGWPRGYVVHIIGPPGSGKTSLLLAAIAQAQNRGGAGALIDADHGFDINSASQYGIDGRRCYFHRPRSLEEAWEVIYHLASDGLTQVIGLDSIASLLTTDVHIQELRKHPDTLAREMNTNALRLLLPRLAESNTLLLITNQIEEKVGVMFGNPETVPWHTDVVRNAASVMIEVRRTETLKKGPRAIGGLHTCKVTKSRLAAPFNRCEFAILFDRGVSAEASVLQSALSLELVTRPQANKPAFYYGRRAIGRDWAAVVGFLRDNEQVFQSLIADLREAMADEGHNRSKR